MFEKGGRVEKFAIKFGLIKNRTVPGMDHAYIATQDQVWDPIMRKPGVLGVVTDNKGNHSTVLTETRITLFGGLTAVALGTGLALLFVNVVVPIAQALQS